MPTPDDVKARVTAAYDRAADSYDHALNRFWERYGRRSIERLAIPSGARVLDLCCGSGASAIPAAERVGERGRVVDVELERGDHPIRDEQDLAALLRGTGYRGTLDQLAPEQVAQVRNEVLTTIRARDVRSIRTDVVLAHARSSR